MRCWPIPSASLDRDWAPKGGETNPFLHLSLHLAVAEQLAIDQPAGIVAAVRPPVRGATGTSTRRCTW